ncbi:MAG: hypothetical protein DCF31_13780, partial [Alphaproteobacteria bacterium]
TPTPGGPAASCPTGTADVGIINNLRNCQISGNILGNLSVRNLRGVIYSLSGRVNVGTDRGGDPNAPIAGSTAGILTIEPGTVLFGSSGADSLVINRGSQIFAEGTATQPIIFTSRSNIEGSAGVNTIGQWGGIVVLGRAPIHTCIGAGVVGGSVGCQSAVEGLTGAFYGGATTTDNSGRIRYVQVRYPGFEVAPGNELNGITLAGVGSGTTFENIQIHNSSDDGIEWFGGRVNGRYLVLTGIDDDNIDTDLGYKGFLQFVLAIQRTTGGDRIIEADTAGGELLTPRTNVRLANFTFINRRTADPVLLRGGTDYTLVNGIIAATAPVCLDIDGAQTASTAVDAALDETGAPVFRSVLFGCATPARDEADVPLAAITPLITGNSNVLNYVPSLTNTFFPGATELAAVPFAASTLNPFLVNTTYVGAFRNANDNWFNGWTCGLPGQVACEAAPVNTGS